MGLNAGDEATAYQHIILSLIGTQTVVESDCFAYDAVITLQVLLEVILDKHEGHFTLCWSDVLDPASLRGLLAEKLTCLAVLNRPRLEFI